MGAEHHSPSSAKTSPRGSGVGGGGEQYSPSTKPPRAAGGGEHYSASSKSPRAGGGGGGGGEHYSASSKSPRAGGIGGVSSLLPSGAVATLLDSWWTLSAALTVFLFLAVTLTVTTSSSSLSPVSASFFSFLPAGRADVVEPPQVQQQPQAPATPPPPPPGAGVPRLAYLISGSKGDLDRLWRTLHALYHPRNLYVVHLDREAPVGERLELAARVANSTVFRRVGNVEVIRRANMVTYRGPTMVANTLHACAVLLRRSRDWDWFINLSASDYPLMSQYDVLHVFSALPRNVNFIEHTSRLGWKEGQRAQPLIVDPGLYASKKQDIFYASTRRELPTAFRLYTGSAWVALTRDFAEYVVWGWDNLPRTLLMYYANFVSSPEGYFQTVLCNAPRFVPTVANHDLHHIQWTCRRGSTRTRSRSGTWTAWFAATRPSRASSRATTPCSTPSTPSCWAGAAGTARRRRGCSCGEGGAARAGTAWAPPATRTGCSGRGPARSGCAGSWTGSSGRRRSRTASASSSARPQMVGHACKPC